MCDKIGDNLYEPFQSRHNMRERNGKNTDKENLGELWDIYYNNRFVKAKNLQLKFTH